MITDWSTIWAFLYCAFMSCITLAPRPNGRHFADEIFECTFVNENVWIPIKISLKFVPKGLINNIPALVQIMAWRRAGDKPLSEPMMVSLPTHICVTRPQWDMVVHVHGNVHNLLCITMNINFWWEQPVHDIFFIKDFTKNMLFITTTNSLEILTDSFSTMLAHPKNHCYRYRMSLKQILHGKSLIIEINETHWEIKLNKFDNIWNADIIDVGFI